MSGAFLDRARLVLAFLVIAGLCAALWSTPMLSEDWTHLAEAARDASWRDAFDLAREPLRPLQHLLFHVLALQPYMPDPGPARAVSFVLHAAACLLVYVLARELALGRGAASSAALLFALFPNVKGIAWTAAVSTPGRACFVLAGFLFFVRGLRTRSRLDAALFVASFVLALLFHENAIVLPAVCLVWAALAPEHAENVRDGAATRIRAAWLGLRRPELASVALATLAYAVYLALLRPERHHGLKSLESLPANAVKAALALFPEIVRANVVEFLRAHPGPAGVAVAATLFFTLGALALWILVRGPRIARFALVAVALDLVLPVLGTGFNQRYAYLGSAFLALALGAWAASTWKPWVLFPLIVLGGAWGCDTLRDASEYADAGRRAERILVAACLLRAKTPAPIPVAIVDAPDVWGAEEDIPLFNWGLAEALDRGGCGRGFRLWRTHPFHTGTDVELVTPERVREAVERSEVVLVRGDVPFPALPWVRDE